MVSGRVLILPIQGDGKATIILENVDIDVKLRLQIINKKGKGHIQTDGFSLNFETDNMKTHLTNLFNGDEALGDSMNHLLNENWREILKEVKPAITYAIDEILKSIVNRIFYKVPYYECFLEDSK